MSDALLAQLDSLAAWRGRLHSGVKHLNQVLGQHDLLDAPGQALATHLRHSLASDRLVVALEGHGPRDLAALINALFFSGQSQGSLPDWSTGSNGPNGPATPALCPLELAWDARQPPSLALLPVRTPGDNLSTLRDQPGLWRQLPLPQDDPAALADTLRQLVLTVAVPLDEARSLGLLPGPAVGGPAPTAAPALDEQVRVTVPVWRHARLNWPHPWLQRGLVVQTSPWPDARSQRGAAPALVLKATDRGADLLTGRLPELHKALLQHQLPLHIRRLGLQLQDHLRSLQQLSAVRLTARQAQAAAALADLQTLRAKSGGRLQQMAQRLRDEQVQAERAAQALSELHALLTRQHQHVLQGLAQDGVRSAVQQMRSQTDASTLKLGAARAFDQLGRQLHDQLSEAGMRLLSLHQQLHSARQSLQGEHGITLEAEDAPPALVRFDAELARIEQNHRRHVSLVQRWRLSNTEVMERFCRQLQSRLGQVFGDASREVDAWANGQLRVVADQLQASQRNCQQRQDAQKRILSAGDNLDRSILAQARQHEALLALTSPLEVEFAALLQLAGTPPLVDGTARSPAERSWPTISLPLDGPGPRPAPRTPAAGPPQQTCGMA